ncbi:sensor histidine kinase [Clostridium sp. UBA7503]|uniref:sensor histidine kinase n=1 Tax=Clostridium sp. UBA7503 TaxID=1946377 RepID=UPI003216CD3E
MINNSDDYFLTIKLLGLIFSTYVYINYGSFQSSIIIGLLCFLIINIALYYLENINIRVCLSAISFCISYGLGIKYNSIFFTLIPFTFFDIGILMNIKLSYSFMVTILFITILPKDIVMNYLLFAIFYYIAAKILINKVSKIDKLWKENLMLREKIDKYTREVEKEKNYSKQIIYTTKLEERNKLSKEMHDKVGHTIASSLMHLEATKLVIDKDKNEAKNMINTTIQVLRKGMDDIRETLKIIKPSEEQLGINRVKSIMEDAFSHNSYGYTFNHCGNIDKLTYSHWTCIINNLIEGITNIKKHSTGNNASLNIEVLNKIVRVSIKDNGDGAVNIKKSIGLKAMEERVIDLGGNISFNGENGFTIIMILPLS